VVPFNFFQFLPQLLNILVKFLIFFLKLELLIFTLVNLYIEFVNLISDLLIAFVIFLTLLLHNVDFFLNGFLLRVLGFYLKVFLLCRLQGILKSLVHKVEVFWELFKDELYIFRVRDSFPFIVVLHGCKICLNLLTKIECDEF